MEYKLIPEEDVSHEVLMAVSAAENTPLQSLPLLSDVVDLNALDELFESRDETDGIESVSFVFSDSFVSITYEDHIHIEPIDHQTNVYSYPDDASSLKTAIDSAWQN